MIQLTFHDEYLNQFIHLVDDPLMWAFTLIIVINLILNLIRPYYVKDATLQSDGENSILRNAFTYVVIVIGYPYLCVIGAEAASTAFVLAFIYQYLVWDIGIWIDMGWYMPDSIVKLVKHNMDQNDEKIQNLTKKEDDTDGK